MDPIYQDVVVTIVASGAALVLIQRVRSVFGPSRKSTGCDSCPKCEAQRGAAAPEPGGHLR